MATLKIRFRFNPGRVGSPMDKLGAFAAQTDRFLRALCADVGIATPGKWLAQDFSNESVAFDGVYSEDVPDGAYIHAAAALDALSGADPLEACNRGLVGFGTASEFSRIGSLIDPDEVYYVGLYQDPAQQTPAHLEWRPVSHSKSSEIRRILEAPVVMAGSTQGIIHAWHSGAQPPFFTLRELPVNKPAGELIRCEYRPDQYKRVHDATRAPRTVVHVYGLAKWDKVANTINEIEVEDIEIAEPLSARDFHQFFGSAPGFTGDLSTGDYIARLRGDEE